jgi:hypothetical protein
MVQSLGIKMKDMLSACTGTEMKSGNGRIAVLAREMGGRKIRRLPLKDFDLMAE